METLNIRVIADHIASMGDFVPAEDKDALAQIIMVLSETNIPETVEQRLLDSSRASAVVGHLEGKWRATERRAKAALAAKKAEVAKAFRAATAKTTEASITAQVDSDSEVRYSDSVFIAAQEVADIFQSLRYAIKNMIDSLLELSRTERADRRVT